MIKETKLNRTDSTTANNKTPINTLLYQRTKHNTDLDVKNLCSRKLLELLTTEGGEPLTTQQKQQAQQELITRRHYLKELEQILLQTGLGINYQQQAQQLSGTRIY